MLAEESILARNMNNVIFGSVLLPKGDHVEEDDDFRTDSSEDDEMTIIKDTRMGHKTKSDY